MQNPIKIETGSSLEAQIIGTGQMAVNLKNYLAHQGITAVIHSKSNQLNPNLSTDYLFWFLDSSKNIINELLINLVHHLKTKVILISLDSESGIPVLSNLLSHGLDVCAVSVYHCYGPSMKESVLSVLWKRLHEGFITLPENDQISVAPLYLDDALEAICRIAFSSRVFGRSFTLTGMHPMSLLSLSFRIREETVRITAQLPRVIEADPLSADLTTTAAHLEASKSLQKEINWHPHYDLSRGLANTLAAFLFTSRRQPVLKNENPAAPVTVKSKKKIIRPRISHRSQLFLTVIGFLLAVFWGIVKTNQFATRRVSDLLKLQSAAALTGDTLLTDKLGSQIKNLTALGQTLSVLSGRSLSDRYTEAQANRDLAEVLVDISTVSVAVLTNSSVDLSSKISQINLQIENLLIKYPQASWHSELGLVRELLPAGEWLLGLDKKRTILLVVQNPSEIRPTGGFISAIGYMVMDKGNFLDLNFIDTYQLDANLTGEQIPPEPIRKYLGENTWLIRDSNWNPHAPEAAATIQKLVERASGRGSDGVIFLSAQSIKYILEATGPIITPAGDEISSANILDRVAFNTDNEMSSILTGIRQHALKPGRAISVLRGLFQALRHQEIFIAAADQEISRVLGIQSADGGLEVGSCPLQFSASPCVNDYLMPVEANLGINHADYIVNKKREVEITLLENRQVETVLKFIYQNPPANNDQPGYNYKGYVQVLLPPNTKIESVTEQSSAESLIIDQDLKFEQNKLNLGFYVDVPVNQTRIYIVRYYQELDFDISSDSFAYNMLLQKQQGIIVPTLITLSYPEFVTPSVISQPAVSAAGIISFYLTGDQTENISLQFSSVR